MVNLYLYATEENKIHGSNITLKKEEFQKCRLFVRYSHKPTTKQRPTTISIFGDRCDFCYKDYITLKPKMEYLTNAFTHADVYFNRYATNRPLAAVLHFESAAGRIYTTSDYIREHKYHTIHSYINSHATYHEDTLIKTLFIENNMYENALLFHIDWKIGDQRGGWTKYDDNKIIIIDYNHKSLSQAGGEGRQSFLKFTENLNKNGFKVYKHEPLDPYKSYKAYFLYKNNPLLWRTRDRHTVVINEIQNKRYNVNVYYGSNVDEPLMVEFNQGGHSYNDRNDFYYHKTDDMGLYWQVIQSGTNVHGLQITYYKIYDQLTHQENKMLIKLLQYIEAAIKHYHDRMKRNRIQSKEEKTSSSLPKKIPQLTQNHPTRDKGFQSNPTVSKPIFTSQNPKSQTHRTTRYQFRPPSSQFNAYHLRPTIAHQPHGRQDSAQIDLHSARQASSPPAHVPVLHGSSQSRGNQVVSHQQTPTQSANLTIQTITNGSPSETSQAYPPRASSPLLSPTSHNQLPYDTPTLSYTLSPIGSYRGESLPDKLHQAQEKQSEASENNTAGAVGGTVGGIAIVGLSGGGFFFYRHFDSVRFKI